MKKLGLLAIGTLLLTACDATPGRNHDILPVVHDEAVEPVEHHAETHDTMQHETEAMPNDTVEVHHDEMMKQPHDSVQ